MINFDLHQQHWSRRIGTAWAIMMMVFALLLCRAGGWTIDDGVKQIAAQNGQGIWAEVIPDGPVRSHLDDPGSFAPLDPPFVERAAGGFAIGFSPLTRAFFHLFGGHETALRLALAGAAILLWIALEMSQLWFAFLLLPLTFYGLVPWEHILSWLLLWPLLWVTLVSEKRSQTLFFIVGFLAGPAILLRPETATVVAGIFVWRLIQKRYVRTAVAIFGLAIALTGHWILHGATGHEPLLTQVQLNLSAIHSVSDWLRGRIASLYVLCVRMDKVLPVSLAMFGGFVAAAGLMVWGERRKRPGVFVAGLVLLVGWVAVYLYRLWSHVLPPFAIMYSNSFFTALPWAIVLLLPPYRKRPAFVLALICMVAVVLSTPVWRGVHWGPRLLLFAVPLLVIDLYQSQRARGWAFYALLGVALVQTASSALLVYARDDELADRQRLLENKMGNVVVCAATTQCADLAPLWPGREFFTTNNSRELRQLLIQFREIGVDTCWLHLEAHDPLYISAFPNGKPVWPHKMTVLNAGSLVKTQWRMYELVVNAQDTGWVRILQEEAGTLLTEDKGEQALRLQREAVELAPESATTHHDLALILSNLGRTKEASEEVERALELDPSLTAAQRLQALTAPSADTLGGAAHPEDSDRAP